MVKNAERTGLHTTEMTEAAFACFRNTGVTMEIPYAYLWGRQPRSEYDYKTLRGVRHALQDQGRTFLVELF